MLGAVVLALFPPAMVFLSHQPSGIDALVNSVWMRLDGQNDQSLRCCDFVR